MNKEKNFVSAVVYVRNAQNEIKGFLGMLTGVFKENFEHSEIICVNDHSSDKTVDEIKVIAKGITGMTITVVNLSAFHGLESAMTAGNNLSIGDFIFEFDSVCVDYNTETIMDIYRKALEGYDIVSAISDKGQKASSRLFYWALNKLSETPLEIHTERFRILSRRVFNRIDDMNKTVPYRKVVYANAGLRMTSIKYVRNRIIHENRTDKTERKYRVRLASDALVLFTDVGYRLSLAMTITMMALAIVMAAYSVFIYMSAEPIEGWTTTVLFLSVAFFGLFGVLTVILKYLQVIMTLVFKRKQYSFEGIEKLTK